MITNASAKRRDYKRSNYSAHYRGGANMKPLRDTAKRHELRLPMLVAAFVWIALAPSPYAAGDATEPARSKGVLALYWNGRDDPAHAPMDKGVQSGLRSSPAGSIEYYAEYLESSRFPGESQSLLMRDYLRQKYGDNRIDVLIAPSRPSLNFLLKYRNDLFPNTPIVYHAATRADVDKRGEANGVPVVVDSPFRNTVDLALKIH